MRTSVTLLVAALLCLSLGLPVHATNLRLTELRDLATISDAVLQGKLLSKNVLLGPNDVPWTIYTMSVDRVMAGSVDSNSFSFRCIGGPHGDKTLVMSGTPQLAVGDVFVLFYTATESLCQIQGLDKGVFWVTEGAGAKKRLVDHSGTALAALTERGPLLSAEVVERPNRERAPAVTENRQADVGDASSNAGGVGPISKDASPPPPAADADQILDELAEFSKTNVRNPRKVLSTTGLKGIPTFQAELHR